MSGPVGEQLRGHRVVVRCKEKGRECADLAMAGAVHWHSAVQQGDTPPRGRACVMLPAVLYMHALVTLLRQPELASLALARSYIALARYARRRNTQL